MTYTCEKHNISDLVSWCPACVSEFENRQQPATQAERIAAFRTIPDQLTIPFSDIHQWMTEIMGRDVFTHEFARPDLLLAELEDGHTATLNEVLGKLPADKPIILVEP
jgi:hypothetical protein